MDAEWTLTPEQMFFLRWRQDAINTAYDTGDLTYLDSLEASNQYRVLFGDMSFDEANDRYECMLEELADAST